jgi:hypothetical protein
LPSREAADIAPSGVEDVAGLVLREAGEKRVGTVTSREPELFFEQRNDLVQTDPLAVSESAVCGGRPSRNGKSQEHSRERNAFPERTRRVAVLDDVAAREPGLALVRVPGELPQQLDRPRIADAPFAREQQEELGVREVRPAFGNRHRPPGHPARHERVIAPSRPGWNVMDLDAQ